MIESPAAGAERSAPALAVPDRRRAKRRAAWRRRGIVLAFLSPWIVGFCIFFGYPLVIQRVPLVHSYDLLNPPRWVGLGNYRYLFQDDPEIWTAVKNTLWLIAIAVPLQVLFAFGIAMMLTRARTGAGVFRTVFYLPALAPPVAATLGFVYLLNPATGPVNTGLEQARDRRAALVQRPRVVEAVADAARDLGHRQHRWSSSSRRSSTSRSTSTSRPQLDGAGAFQRLRWVTLPTISPVILFAVVIGRDPGAAVLHAGVRRRDRRRRPGVAGRRPSSTLELGYPEGSTLFYPILLYYNGFRFFHMGYASAMAMLLLAVAFALTLADPPELAPLGALPGSGCGERAPPSPRRSSRRKPPARRAPAALPRRRRRPQPPDRAPRSLPRAGRLHRADGADDARARRSRRKLWPEPFEWSNFTDVFHKSPLLRWALNSFIYAGLATLGLLVSSIPVAYAFSRLRWRGRDAVFLVVLVALMLPPQVTVVPLYVMWAKLDLVGTLWPLIIPNWFGDAFAIFLLRQFFLTIPEEYLDAARVDGCGEFRILTTVVLRLAKPAIAAVALFSILYTLQRLLPAAALRRREPGQLGRLDRALAVPLAAPGAVEPRRWPRRCS